MKPSPPSPPGRASVGFATPADGAADRETREPSEERPPLSLWLITFMGVWLFWGGLYLQRYSGGYSRLGYNEKAAESGGANSKVAMPVDPYVQGRRLFENTCAKCHQLDGQGLPGQYPPLVGSEWVLAEDPGRLIRIVLDGLQGPIQVKGLEFNNVMTPWRDNLTDPQIAAVLTFVRGQKEWGNHAAPVTPEAVAAIRLQTKNRAAAGAWTAAELLALPDHEPRP